MFIPTTWEKFVNAVEINDLYDESSLEDQLWAQFKRLEISAERQAGAGEAAHLHAGFCHLLRFG